MKFGTSVHFSKRKNKVRVTQPEVIYVHARNLNYGFLSNWLKLPWHKRWFTGEIFAFYCKSGLLNLFAVTNL